LALEEAVPLLVALETKLLLMASSITTSSTTSTTRYLITFTTISFTTFKALDSHDLRVGKWAFLSLSTVSIVAEWSRLA
jgi:hypothetical protein